MVGRPSENEKQALEGLQNLENEIRKISQVGKAINQCGLKRRTICLLLADMSKLPMRDIDIILNNLPLLEKEYLKK